MCALVVVIAALYDLLISGSLSRALKDNVLVLQNPLRGRDGKLMQSIHVPKDTTVWIGNYNCGVAREIWGEDALEWKPERWLGKSPDEVAKVKLPGVYSSM